MNSKLIQGIWVIIFFPSILSFYGCGCENNKVDDNEEKGYGILAYKVYELNDESRCVYSLYRTSLSVRISPHMIISAIDKEERRKDDDIDNFTLIKEMAQTIFETESYSIDSITGEKIISKGENRPNYPIHIYVFDRIYKNWGDTGKTISSLTDAELNVFKSEIESMGMEVKVFKNMDGIALQYFDHE
ncbi:MAG: hypothetical protein JEZ07_12480 [Phycisphaerae bacterium]|nr:hypothetical protein [Phycisphaerae bacterium]